MEFDNIETIKRSVEAGLGISILPAPALATEVRAEGQESASETFAGPKRHYSEREVCDIVWLVASEHIYNLTNVGLNIGADSARWAAE